MTSTDKQYIGVRLDFTLRTPMVVPNGPKPVDAVLSWAAVRRAEFEGQDDPWALQHEFGVAWHRVGNKEDGEQGDACLMASELEIQWADSAEVIGRIKRQKIEDYELAYHRGIINKERAFDGKRGFTSAGLMVNDVRLVKSMKAWVVVDGEGGLVKLKSLLPWVTHVGKLWHKDFGAVRYIDAEIDERALTLWHQRPLPVGSPVATDLHAMSMGSLVAPYWDRRALRPMMAFAG